MHRLYAAIKKNFLNYPKQKNSIRLNTPTAFLQKGKTGHNKCPGHDLKSPDGEAPILELWRMCSTPSLPLLPGTLWAGVVALDKVLIMGKIELFEI